MCACACVRVDRNTYLCQLSELLPVCAVWRHGGQQFQERLEGGRRYVQVAGQGCPQRARRQPSERAPYPAVNWREIQPKVLL